MGAVRVAETLGAASVVMEAAENAVGAYQVVGAGKVRITVENKQMNKCANEPEQLNEIFEFKEAAQIDYGLEQLKEIF